jgi:hypothetical protein
MEVKMGDKGLQILYNSLKGNWEKDAYTELHKEE